MTIMDRSLYLITFSAPGIAPVTVMPDETPASIPSGYGGWSVTSRQRRIGLTVWEGKDPLRMQIPILFDGVADRLSQEIQISRLSRMALPPVGGGEPPQVRVKGSSLPQPGPTVWVIENLNWGTNVIRDFAGNGVMARLRQDCTVNLLEYRGDDRVAFKGLQPGRVTANKTASGGQSQSGWPKRYVVKSGDTLRGIAVKFYHDPTKWRKIADANNIRDPNTIKVGQTLRIPAP